MDIKIVPQRAITALGYADSYGVLVNGYPRCIFYSKGELEAFLRALEPRLMIKNKVINGNSRTTS